MAKNDNRDNFSNKTKEVLAKRVAYHCSNPDCDLVTIAPASDSSKCVNVGVAAHICAAAIGGKRFDASMTPKERSSIENGIWLCEICAKLIDSDDQAYPVKLLQAWKQNAECKASQKFTASKVLEYADASSRINILYIYKLFPANGYQSIKNRTLIQTLEKFYSVTLKYGILVDHELGVFHKKYRGLFTPASMLGGYDAVIIEGDLGIFREDGSLDTLKFSADVLKRYKLSGGILIFLSEEHPSRRDLPLYNSFLAYVGFPLFETPQSKMQFPDYNHDADETTYIYGIDFQKAIGGDHTFFEVDLQRSRKLGPIPRNLLKGIETLTVCLPLQLSSSFHAFLVGNDTTKMLSDDCYWDGSLFHIFGAYGDAYAGAAVLITGGICNDIVVNEVKSDAIKLIQNLIPFFVEAEAQRKKLMSVSDS